ncbi:lyase family protein [Streptomyces sp. NPDC021139]|uniref:lyase family protein n=1 Tax=Streptomyces sp. NPDC021139 TaxID=3154899 RepID=UPI0033F3CA24
MGRTQLRDAVPMTLGQEFGAYTATLAEDEQRLGEVRLLLHELNLGGTAIGTALNAPLVTLAAEGGQLQLNAFEPIIYWSLSAGPDHLAAGVGILTEQCVRGITADRQRLAETAMASIAPDHRPRSRARPRDRRRPGPGGAPHR